MSWAAARERGAPWLLRLGFSVVRRGGWLAGRAIAAAAARWFLLTAPAARRASRDYLGRVLGRPATLGDVAQHFASFAAAILDRVMLLSGRQAAFRIEADGLAALTATVAEGRGAILLGAHLGSFEVLRGLACQSPAPVWALMYRRNAGGLTALMDRIAPQLRERVIEIGDTASMLRARECIERGEVVGILADRAPPGHRRVEASLLGGPVRLPSGPFVLAATLGAPVFVFRAVRVGARHYRIGIEPFAGRVVLSRERRYADLQWHVQLYADWLGRSCRTHPFQWFNFFPFWDADPDADPARPAAAAAARQLPARAR